MEQMITKDFLDKLQTEIDAMLDAETNETLLDWLNNRHKQLLQQTVCTVQLICPECENPYPHSHTDGSYSCEDCGHKWAN